MSPGIFHIRRLYFFPPDDSPDIVQNDSAHLIPAFHREIKTDLSRPKAKDFFRLIRQIKRRGIIDYIITVCTAFFNCKLLFISLLDL